MIHIIHKDAQTLIVQSQAGAHTTDATSSHLYGSFNLGLHVGDNASSVLYNRAMLMRQINQQAGAQLTHIAWLNQTHSCDVARIDTPTLTPLSADALITDKAGLGLAIMTADCVPIAIVSRTGGAIACVHAGWQGLTKGIIAQTLAKLPNDDYHAYIGACISGAAYEMDRALVDEIVATCVDKSLTNLDKDALFKAVVPFVKDDKAHLDVVALAKQQLKKVGVTLSDNEVTCSYQGASQGQYYSHRHATHRQQPATGRMAMVVVKLPDGQF